MAEYRLSYISVNYWNHDTCCVACFELDYINELDNFDFHFKNVETNEEVVINGHKIIRFVDENMVYGVEWYFDRRVIAFYRYSWEDVVIRKNIRLKSHNDINKFRYKLQISPITLSAAPPCISLEEGRWAGAAHYDMYAMNTQMLMIRHIYEMIHNYKKFDFLPLFVHLNHDMHTLIVSYDDCVYTFDYNREFETFFVKLALLSI